MQLFALLCVGRMYNNPTDQNLVTSFSSNWYIKGRVMGSLLAIVCFVPIFGKIKLFMYRVILKNVILLIFGKYIHRGG